MRQPKRKWAIFDGECIVPYVGRDKDGKDVVLPLVIRPAAEHRVYYAHGAQGGFVQNYHFRMDFYQDEVPPLQYTDPSSTGALNYEALKEGIKRTIVSSVILPLPFLKELSVWLQKQVSEAEALYGEIQLPRDNIPSALLPAQGEAKDAKPKSESDPDLKHRPAKQPRAGKYPSHCGNRSRSDEHDDEHGGGRWRHGHRIVQCQ